MPLSLSLLVSLSRRRAYRIRKVFSYNSFILNFYFSAPALSYYKLKLTVWRAAVQLSLRGNVAIKSQKLLNKFRLGCPLYKLRFAYTPAATEKVITLDAIIFSIGFTAA